MATDVQGSEVADDSPLCSEPKSTKQHFGPGAFLTPDEVRELSQINAKRMFAALGFDLAVIAVACAISERIGHPFVYVIAVMVIGGRLAGIGSIALHEGVHHLLLKDRAWNDRLGACLSCLVFTPLLITFADYRKSHFGHHRNTNTDDDPDLMLTESFYRVSRVKAVLGFLISLSGVLFVLAVIRFLIRNGRSNPLGFCSVLALASAISIGFYLDVYAARIAFWYWIVPFATWGIFVNQIRAFAEHYPEYEYGERDVPEVFRTRDILNSWFDTAFVVTRGLNYHLAHHLCPQVPFYNLPRLQKKLAASPIYQQNAHVTHGYHRVIWEFLFRQRTVDYLKETR